MSVYDKNLKRIAEIRRGIAKGQIDPERGNARIAKYKAKGPEYWVKGYAYGKHYDEQAPEGGIKAARAYDRRLRVQVEDHTYTPAELLKAKLKTIFDAHLKAQAGKGGEKAARTRCGHASRIFGHLRLDKLHASPKALLEPGFNGMPVEWVQTTKWHLWAFMKAAIDRYKRENPKIQINNPMTAYPVSRGYRRREEAPTLAEHLDVLAHIKANPYRIVAREKGKGPMKTGYPAYLYPLMVIRGEQGLRGMEVIPWRFEKADLEAKRPAVMTRILKKDGARADQWVVLTPTSYRALKAYLDTIPGPKEYGAIWPVKNWPTKLVRRALDRCGLQHLVAHDWRRFWTMNNIDKNKERRKAAVGRETDDSEDFYKHFNREAQEEFYADEWAEHEKNISESSG